MPKAVAEKAEKKATKKKVTAKEAVKNTKVIAGKDTTKASKQPTKAAPAKTEKVKAEKKAAGPYAPQKGTMRYFVYKAAQKGGTPKKIIARAAEIGAKAKAEKGASEEDYKGFGNLEFFFQVLEKNGVTVKRDGDKRQVVV